MDRNLYIGIIRQCNCLIVDERQSQRGNGSCGKCQISGKTSVNNEFERQGWLRRIPKDNSHKRMKILHAASHSEVRSIAPPIASAVRYPIRIP